jgi:hypothetical protein
MFITLTSITNPRQPKPLHVLASSIEGITTDNSSGHTCTVIRTGGNSIWYVKETPDEILGLIGSRGEPRAADRHLFTLAADELFNLGAKPDLVAQLQEAAEYWRGAGSPPEPDIHQLQFALDEWCKKTDWVQKQRDSFSFNTLGMHRADVLRREIEHLRASKGLTRDQIQDLAHGFMLSDDKILFMIKVDALLRGRK